jgi:hypothetical protein
MSQLTTMAATSGAERCFKCPYHATVIKLFDTRRSSTVSIAAQRTTALAAVAASECEVRRLIPESVD